MTARAQLCELCGRATYDYRETGYFCTDRCKDEYAEQLARERACLQEPLVTRLDYIL